MNADLQRLGRRLVGRWTTQATHPGLPGAVVRGSSEIEWLEGERFLIYRSSYDPPGHPRRGLDHRGHRRPPHALLRSRGVHRIDEVTVTNERWEMAMGRHASAGSFASPDAPFSQRMTYTFEDQGQTMSGKGQLSFDDVNWQDDLEIMYRRLL